MGLEGFVIEVVDDVIGIFVIYDMIMIILNVCIYYDCWKLNIIMKVVEFWIGCLLFLYIYVFMFFVNI